jgi:EAL domain-containing protein (putative c-di-GMP-specific phosphodiesterase class I)
MVMLTGSGADTAVFEAADAGCAGYVNKAAPRGELVRVLLSVCHGAVELPADELARLPRIADLVVHYQPIVDLTDAYLQGFEALVRWSHPERGLLPPSDFLPLAERTPLIVRIDDKVRDEACQRAAQWNSAFRGRGSRFIAVNISAHDLSTGLSARVARTLERSGLGPADLVVEITETTFMEGSVSNLAVLDELRKLGVRIALDDFGTGYSSLAYLQRFPIDIIKLDKSFTDDLPQGARGLRVVEAVGRLAADLGAVAEAEGVENKDQAECLGSIGWKLAQGHYFSRAMDASAVGAMLASGPPWPSGGNGPQVGANL